MKDKLILVDVRENNRKRGTQVIIYDEAHEMLKELSTRTGQSMSMIANRMIKFAYNFVEIDGEEE